MTDNILTIRPALKWKRLRVFEVEDQFNGHQRGTHWYITETGTLRGPFHSDIEATFHLIRDTADDGA